MAGRLNRLRTRVRLAAGVMRKLVSRKPRSAESPKKEAGQPSAQNDFFNFYRGIILNEAKYFRDTEHSKSYVHLQNGLLKPKYYPETTIIRFTGDRKVDSEIQLGMAAFKEMVNEINDLKRQTVRAKVYSEKERLVLEIRRCEGIITMQKNRVFLLISEFLDAQSKSSEKK